jgi:hypothetical protein
VKTVPDLIDDATTQYRHRTVQNQRMYTCDYCHRKRPRSRVLLGRSRTDQRILIGRGYNGSKGGTPWPKVECRTDRQACEWYASLWRQVHVAVGNYERDRKQVTNDEE